MTEWGLDPTFVAQGGGPEWMPTFLFLFIDSSLSTRLRIKGLGLQGLGLGLRVYAPVLVLLPAQEQKKHISLLPNREFGLFAKGKRRTGKENGNYNIR